MVKNITGIVNVLIIIFLLYRTAVCATRKEFKVSDIILFSSNGCDSDSQLYYQNKI